MASPSTSTAFNASNESGSTAKRNGPYYGTNGTNVGAEPPDAFVGKRPKPKWRNFVENFSQLWFAVSMNTGVLGILIWTLPYQFTGQRTVAAVVYVFNIVLFSVIFLISLLRWTMFLRQSLQRTAGNIEEICFLGTAPIAFMTLTGATALVVSNTSWGGYPFTIVAYVMFWICVGWSVVTGFTTLVVCFRTEVTYDRTMSPAICLPVVSMATCAVIGGLICLYSHNMSYRLQVPVIIVSYFLNGATIWLALIIYGMMINQLMAVGWPPAAKRPGLFMLIGPFGQIPAALLLLGNAASSGAFALYNKGTVLTAEGGKGFASSSVLLALLILGMDYFWIFAGLWAIADGWMKRELTYTPVWWATIFPLATTTTAWISLSEAMDSPTFRVLATGLLLILIVDYLVNWVFTIYYGFMGNLFIKPEEDERDD